MEAEDLRRLTDATVREPQNNGDVARLDLAERLRGRGGDDSLRLVRQWFVVGIVPHEISPHFALSAAGG